MRAAKLREPDLAIPFLDFPQLYGMRLDGVCCEPEMMHGSLCIADQQAEYKGGDFVILWIKTARHGHPVVLPMVKRLVMAPPRGFALFPHVMHPGSNVAPLLVSETLKPAKTYQVDCQGVYGVHKVVGQRPGHGAKVLKIGDAI